MGRNFGQRRKRMESFQNPGPETLAAIGARDINFEKFDEQEIFNKINRKLDEVEKRLPTS